MGSDDTVQAMSRRKPTHKIIWNLPPDDELIKMVERHRYGGLQEDEDDEEDITK